MAMNRWVSQRERELYSCVLDAAPTLNLPLLWENASFFWDPIKRSEISASSFWPEGPSR